MELQELIKSVDIVEFISQYVDLEEKNGEWWGLSPFQEEKTPSFSVRQEPPLFYDFSSGKGGNLFSFVKNFFKCSNKEATEIIKQYAGVEGEVYVRQEKMAATLICKRFSQRKQNSKQCKSTVLPDDYMERYEKRADKIDVWRKEGISDTSLERFQVYYDGFSNRLVYPIRNPEGQIVNVGGRTLDPDWKEKKQRKYCYFYSWGTINTIYGLAENMEYIKNKGEIILFEGCKSVLLADTWGIKNTGAILTSHLSNLQMKLLIKLGCKVVFALDKDIVVQDDKNIAKLKKYVNVEYIYDFKNKLDSKDSPVDKGKKVFEDLYRTRIKLR